MQKLAILNQALLKIGVSKTIISLTENTREAYTLGLLYDPSLREVLRSYPWAFATKYADSTTAASGDAMELFAGTSTVPVNGDWQYAYRYPEDCLLARRLVNAATGRRYDANPIPFRVGRDVEGEDDTVVQLIYTNQVDAVLEYTALVVMGDTFADPLFEDCLSWFIGSKAAPSLSRDDKMAQRCLVMADVTFQRGTAVSAREAQLEPPGQAEWISGR